MINIKLKYKIKYDDILIFVINGDSALLQEEDAIIFSSLFRYRIFLDQKSNHMISFPYVRISSKELTDFLIKINKLEINFLVIENDKPVSGRKFADNKYRNYLDLNKYSKYMNEISMLNNRIRLDVLKLAQNHKADEVDRTQKKRENKYWRHDLEFEKIDTEFRERVAEAYNSSRNEISEQKVIDSSLVAKKKSIVQSREIVEFSRRLFAFNLCITCSKMYFEICDGTKESECIGYSRTII